MPEAWAIVPVVLLLLGIIVAVGGLFGSQIALFTQDDATIVPAGALFRRGDQWNVYVVTDGRAQIRKIQLFRRSGRFAAIASGLNQGEAAIVYPSDRVAPGARVGPRKVGDLAGGS
jgi:HlyD family secretion protein